MTVALRSQSTLGYGSHTTSVSVTAPSGVVSGDVMFMGAVTFVTSGGTAPTPTPPTGWVAWPGTTGGLLKDFPTFDNQAGWDMRIWGFTKVSAGSEPGSYTVAQSASANSAYWIGDYSGVDNTTPAASSPSPDSGTGQTSTALSVTPTVNGSRVIIISADNGDSTTNLSLTGFTNEISSPLVLGILDMTQTTAGAVGNKTFANNNNASANNGWLSTMLVLNAAASGVAFTPPAEATTAATATVTTPAPALTPSAAATAAATAAIQAKTFLTPAASAASAASAAVTGGLPPVPAFTGFLTLPNSTGTLLAPTVLPASGSSVTVVPVSAAAAAAVAALTAAKLITPTAAAASSATMAATVAKPISPQAAAAVQALAALTHPTLLGPTSSSTTAATCVITVPASITLTATAVTSTAGHVSGGAGSTHDYNRPLSTSTEDIVRTLTVQNPHTLAVQDNTRGLATQTIARTLAVQNPHDLAVQPNIKELAVDG